MSAVIFLQVHITKQGRPFSSPDRVPGIDIMNQQHISSGEVSKVSIIST